MAYSNNLRIELITTGTQAGTWGNTTNSNLGTIIEDSIAGYVTVLVTSASYALTALDGAEDEARNAIIRLTTSYANAFAVYAPPVSKLYTIFNDTAYTATVYNATIANGTTPAGTGIAIAAGQTATIWSNATNFYAQNTQLVGTPTAPTAAAGTNTTQIATTAFVQTALQLLYPVGSIYTNATNGSNPSTLFLFGTWVAFGAGRVAVGFDAGNPLFDTAQETGGAANSVVVTHNHTLSSTLHTHSGSVPAGGAHQHYVSADTNSDTGINEFPNEAIARLKTSGTNSEYRLTTTPGVPATMGLTSSASGGGGGAFTTGNNSVSPTVDNAGVTGVNANYQPYITVYMWRRTA
jgi:hypothetical protein